MRLLTCVFVASVMVSACTATPAGPGPVPSSPTITSLTVRGFQTAIVTGVPVQLSLLIAYDDGSTDIATTGVHWSTSDSTIATVDAQGLLTPLAGGTITIDAAVKGTTVTVPMRVFASVSGRWVVTMPAGDGRWTSKTEATIVQENGKLTGAWQWDSGTRLALEGTIAANGDILLRGRECYGGFTYGTVLYEVRDWRMTFDVARGVYEGTMEHRVSGRYIGGPCTGAMVYERPDTVQQLPVEVTLVR